MLFKKTYRGSKADLDFFFGFDPKLFGSKLTIRYGIDKSSESPKIVAPCVVKKNIWTARDEMPIDGVCLSIFYELLEEPSFKKKCDDHDFIYISVEKAEDEFGKLKMDEASNIARAVLEIPNPKIPEDVFKTRYAHFWIFTKEEYENMISGSEKVMEYRSQLPLVIKHLYANYGNTANFFDIVDRTGKVLFTLPPLTPSTSTIDLTSDKISKQLAEAYFDHQSNEKYNPRKAQVLLSDRLTAVAPGPSEDAKRDHLIKSMILIENARKFYGLPPIVKKQAVVLAKVTQGSSSDDEEFSNDDFI